MPEMPDVPAILGGTPIRAARYIEWPEWVDDDRLEIDAVLRGRVISKFFGGSHVREFEAELERFHGGGYAVALSSGTAALHCAYSAAGIAAGDEVIMPVNCYISAAVAALQLNAIPVFSDIHPTSLVLDPKRIEHWITPSTKAIVAVHMYGIPVDMDAVLQVARRYGLTVIEDCSQAIGARWRGRLVGTYGDIATFSFYGSKLVCSGEGGMVLTRDENWAETVRRLAHKGKGPGWLDYEHMGYSYSLTELQAVLGISTLRRLPAEIRRRRCHAARYGEHLQALGLEVHRDGSDAASVYYRYPFHLPPERARSIEWIDSALAAENVTVLRGYPCLHAIPWIAKKEYSAWQLSEAGRRRQYRIGDHPVAEGLAARQLAASTGTGLSIDDVEDTIRAISRVLQARAPVAQVG
jgi:perosamine synthetase